MKSAIDKLGYKDKQLLSQFFEGETYKALRNLIDIERVLLAQDHVGQKDMLEVRYLSGQDQGLKRLVGTLKYIHQESLKNDKLKQAQAKKS